MDDLIGSGEAIGYVASGLVFLTFCMKTMMPLRLLAIASNVAFISYGTANGLVPIIVLHTLLLPMNAVRTWQIWHLVRRTRESQITELSIEDLLPHMAEESFRSGEMIFQKGDTSAKLYYLSQGRVHI
jgi:CRP/FNR family cyclic AMP-dependent transcriptional regulator